MALTPIYNIDMHEFLTELGVEYLVLISVYILVRTLIIDYKIRKS